MFGFCDWICVDIGDVRCLCVSFWIAWVACDGCDCVGLAGLRVSSVVGFGWMRFLLIGVWLACLIVGG